MSLKKHLGRQLAAIKYGLKWRKPIFMARMAKFYLESFIVRKKQPLRYVDFAVDYSCNLKCAHCFMTSLKNPGGKRRLTIDDYRRISKECIDMGAIHLSLQGGEATLLKNLKEIVRSMSPNRVLFSITTNGTTITDGFSKDLLRMGVDQLNISIDSFVPSEHDRFRGMKGAFGKTFSGLQSARKAGLNVQVNTTFSKFNLYTPGCLALVDYCTENKIILNVVLAAPAGNWDAYWRPSFQRAQQEQR